ncbi:MAG: adenylyltransferase/cytidyltransferase family protein [Candidatus Saccharibacteria bacterium]|nr:adenylyltransferase/cytidyltransferase family protein [Candidatus Saccharibacteria bacterium]
MGRVRIGYLGGCWDLFHAGHLNYIKKAKENCDYLIVDATPDEIVFKQKGRYPIINEQDRLSVLRAIKYIDRAELSDDGRDMAAFEKYGYNVLFLSEDHRGKDYYNDLERKMKGLGVDVIYIPYTYEISSTMIKDKIGNNNKTNG